jgi:hypothetical protein
LEIPLKIEDVGDFAKGAVRDEVQAVSLISSTALERIDQFYADRFPIKPRPYLSTTVSVRMTHPLSGRQPPQKLAIKRLGVPESW